MPQRRARNQFELLEELEEEHMVHMVGLREAGWSYQRIMCHTGRVDTTIVRYCRQWVEGSTHQPQGDLHKPQRERTNELSYVCALELAQLHGLHAQRP